MTGLDIAAPGWIKSTRSADNGCVEVALGQQVVGMRDSKNPDGSALAFDAETFRAFVADLKRGSFDRR